MSNVRYWRTQIRCQLNELEEIWSKFLLDTSITTSTGKLDIWYKDTDKVLKTIGKNDGLDPVSHLARETASDPVIFFQEEVNRYRIFLSLLVKELDKAQSDLEIRK